MPNSEPKIQKTNQRRPKRKHSVGLHTINNSDILIIAEGAFDALSFEQEGYSVLATMGGHFFQGTIKNSNIHMQTVPPKYFLCFDNDTAGEFIYD